MLTLAAGSPLGQYWLQTEQRSFAWMLLPLVVLENVQALFLSDLRARRRAAAYSLSAVLRLLAIVAASVWFVAVRQQGIHGIFLGRLVGDAVGVFVSALLCLPATRLRFNKAVVTPMVAYGLPLAWATLMVLLMDASGRYFLSRYGSLDQVGFYGAAIKISGLFQMLIYQPFGVAWGGFLFQIAKQPHARLIYSKVLAYLLIVSLSVALAFALMAPALFVIFAPTTYLPAMTVFPLILLTRAVNVLEYPAAVSLYLADRTSSFALIYSVGPVINICANYFLVPRNGMFGAAWSWLAAWVAIIILMAGVGQRHYRLDYDWRFLLLAILPGGLLLLGPHRLIPGLSHLSWPAQAAFGCGILFAAILLLARDFQITRGRLQSDAQPSAALAGDGR